jgi:hypothetical protein
MRNLLPIHPLKYQSFTRLSTDVPQIVSIGREANSKD